MPGSTSEDTAKIYADFPSGKDTVANNSAKIINFANRLATIHPLLAELSPSGNRSGYKSMLKQPRVQDMTEAQWAQLLKLREDDDGLGLGKRVSFWNRQPNGDDGMILHITLNAAKENNNGMDTPHFPLALAKREILMEISQAAIEVFDATGSQVATILDNFDFEKRKSYLWCLWKKDGHAVVDSDLFRIDPQQGESDPSVPWLDGTLYTWPAFAPWKLLKL